MSKFHFILLLFPLWAKTVVETSDQEEEEEEFNSPKTSSNI